MKRFFSEPLLPRARSVSEDSSGEASLIPVGLPSAQICPRNNNLPMITTFGEAAQGDQNTLNLCYVNSIMQCLTHTSAMRVFFLRDVENIGGAITWLVHDIMKNLWSGESTSASMQFLRETLGERTSRDNIRDQQDAQEFLTGLLELLHGELEDDMPPEDGGNVSSSQGASDNIVEQEQSYISRTFYGQTRSFIQCGQCETKFSHKEKPLDSFSTLIVPVSEGYRRKSIFRSIETQTVEECIESYLTGPEMTYMCKNCDSEELSREVQEFSQLPPVLVIVFNRGMIDPETNESRKNNDPVAYGLKLQLTVGDKNNRTSKKMKYRLKGVCCHSGTMEDGHYYSYCLKNGDWYKYDDATVERTRRSEVLDQKRNGYMLFYEVQD